jgi:putative tryptophan/tyrosine transport system substrate-binding protein
VLPVTGYDEGRSVAIEYRWSEGDYDKLPALAAELVRRQVAVIATINTPTILLPKRQAKQFRSSLGSASIRSSSA